MTSLRPSTAGARALGIVVSLLLPGAGHIARGRLQRGIAWACVFVAGLAVGAFVWQVLIAAQLLRLGAAVDAGIVRQGAGHGEHVLWISVIAGLAGLGAHRFGYAPHVMEAFKIPSGAMKPALSPGDKIFVSKLGQPGLGDVVAFDWPCDRDYVFVSRIVATEGQTVEMRCSQLYVDGTLLEQLKRDRGCTSREDEAGDGRYRLQPCIGFAEQTSSGAREVIYSVEAAAEVGSASHDTDFPLCFGPTFSCRDQAGRQFPGEVEPVAHRAGPCRPQLRYRVPPGHVFTISDNRHESLDSRNWGPVPRDHLIGTVAGVWLHGR